MTDADYCQAQVRRFDPDRFLCAQFAPRERRGDLLALLAFNTEVARIPELVCEPTLGLMRLSWWRDAMEGIFSGSPPDHPVARALSRTVEGLSRAPFEALFDAREKDFHEAAFPDLADLEAYCAATSAGLAELSLTVLGVTEPKALEAGRSVGTAWALSGLLRAVPFHARKRRCYLPDAVIERAGGDRASFRSELFEGRGGGVMEAGIAAVAGRAEALLRAARDRRPGVPRAALSALLPARLASSDLSNLARAGFDPFKGGGKNAARLLSLIVGAFTGRY